MPGHIPWTKVEAWLGGARSIWLATTRSDGRPHAVPVWFWWDGTRLYFNAAPGSRKLANLRNQPSAVAHLGDGDDTLIIEGSADEVTDTDEIARIDAAYRTKYVDPHSGATAGFPESPTTTPFRLNAERIMIWEYGVVTTRTDFLPTNDDRFIQSRPEQL